MCLLHSVPYRLRSLVFEILGEIRFQAETPNYWIKNLFLGRADMAQKFSPAGPEISNAEVPFSGTREEKKANKMDFRAGRPDRPTFLLSDPKLYYPPEL